MEYDGKAFPFEDATFGIVFSSNALEHIVDLAQLHRESRWVLKRDGYCVHVMPTALWTFWMGVGNYVELVQRLSALLLALLPRGLSRSELKRPVRWLQDVAQVLRPKAVPHRHGETGSYLTELWTFSRRHWIRHFRAHGFKVLCVEPMQLFYTGRLILGLTWSLPARARASELLGSACVLYKVQPRARPSGSNGARHG